MDTTLRAGCKRLEDVLDPLGFIPVVSSFSGAFRILVGKIQLVAGLAFACLALVLWLFTGNEELFEAAKIGACYALNGAQNIFRGSVEIIPIVNLLCIPYNIAIKPMVPSVL